MPAENPAGAPRFLAESDVATLTGLAPKTLRNWRSSRRNGPAFMKLGARVRYAETAVEKWLADRTVHPEARE